MQKDPSITAEEQGKLFSHIQLNSTSIETNACFTIDDSMTAEKRLELLKAPPVR